VLNDRDPYDPDVNYAGNPYAEASFECTDIVEVVASPDALSPGDESVVDLSHALPTSSDEKQRYLRFHEVANVLPSFAETNHALSDASSKRQSTESFSDVSGSSGESPPKVRVVEKPPPAPYVTCGEEMKKRVKQLATENVRMLPDAIWTQVKQEMNEKYGDCWTGKTREYVQGLVLRTQRETGMGDKLKVLEDDPTLKNLPDGTPFLQFHGSYPHPDEPKEMCRYMIFGSLTLIAVLLAAGLDLFIDGTFDMTPVPFYQVLIIMAHCRQTGLYVPVLYCLMSHKTEDLYKRVIAEVLHCAQRLNPKLKKLDVRNFTTDFELGLINACSFNFPDAVHIGCYFHFMQAIRKYMIEKLYFDRETVSTFMEEVVILTLIPIAKVQIYGVPYLRQIFEPDGLDEREVARWEKFWAYFERQWLKTVDPHSWNVHDATDDVKDFINRTNNPIESYNSRFNGKFHTSGRLSLSWSLSRSPRMKRLTGSSSMMTYASFAALERTGMSGCSLNFLKHSLISERTTMISFSIV
jgi:hypothetical protein